MSKVFAYMELFSFSIANLARRFADWIYKTHRQYVYFNKETGVHGYRKRYDVPDDIRKHILEDHQEDPNLMARSPLGMEGEHLNMHDEYLTYIRMDHRHE